MAAVGAGEQQRSGHKVDPRSRRCQVFLRLGRRADLACRAGAIRSAFKAFGGHATLIRAPESVRQSAAAFEPQPPALAALTQRVKASFDPQRVLNQSRMYEGV